VSNRHCLYLGSLLVYSGGRVCRWSGECCVSWSRCWPARGHLSPQSSIPIPWPPWCRSRPYVGRSKILRASKSPEAGPKMPFYTVLKPKISLGTYLGRVWLGYFGFWGVWTPPPDSPRACVVVPFSGVIHVTVQVTADDDVLVCAKRAGGSFGPPECFLCIVGIPLLWCAAAARDDHT